MTDHRLEGPGENGAPVPRDLPDQQAGTGEDPWDAAPAGTPPETPDTEDEEHTAVADDTEGTDVPDTDEAGTGRQGAPHSGTVHPEHPVPDESSG
ncbi:hypothetical protein [Streptomyces sp. AC627_RSS907]|uniref:hypothetical protein n=1 Tax=Streptomyces sp. AC627_RSS907 TaxID=2823684 RepID=UPI001C22E626|nr:hypothetical protein [Streptomyces sp. AC627_RSS907]